MTNYARDTNIGIPNDTMNVKVIANDGVIKALNEVRAEVEAVSTELRKTQAVIALIAGEDITGVELE